MIAGIHPYSLKSSWKNSEHEKQWRGSLRKHARPLWETPIGTVTPADVLNCLKPIWYEIPTTAKRVMGRMELVFDAARAEGLIEGANPATWKGNLQAALPKLKREPVHHPAIELGEVQAFWRWLTAQESMSARCVQFMLLTATRSGEARGAKWNELDIEEAVWTIPGARTKNGETHRIPLSDAALNLISGLQDHQGNVVLPSASTWDVMTDKALQKLCHKSGFCDADSRAITPHGCRAAFRTWAEQHVDEDTAERALGHRRSKLIRSYARGDKLEQRRQLMQDWSTFVLTAESDARAASNY